MINPTPFAELSPDFVLDAVAALGFEPDGRLLALNSFENRVYQVGIESAEPLIAKFYRPGRWSDAAIHEEHAFSDELVEAELPVIAPLRIDGESLFDFDAQRLALFPRRGGRAPELEGLDVAQWLGRLIARIHNVGARRGFSARAQIDVDTRVHDAADHVLDSQLLPAHLAARYAHLIEAVAERLDLQFGAIAPRTLRLHGDCHPGNLLWTDAGPAFRRSGRCRQRTGDPGPVDADGPAATPSARPCSKATPSSANSSAANCQLIEPLRIMRQIHHAGWIAARYDDPAFPRAFPFAAEPRWWEEHCNDLMNWLERDSERRCQAARSMLRSSVAPARVRHATGRYPLLQLEEPQQQAPLPASLPMRSAMSGVKPCARRAARAGSAAKGGCNSPRWLRHAQSQRRQIPPRAKQRPGRVGVGVRFGLTLRSESGHDRILVVLPKIRTDSPPRPSIRT